MAQVRETRRDCPICGEIDALLFFAEYEGADPEVGLHAGYIVDLQPEQDCACRLSGARIRRLEDKVSMELYDDMGSEMEP